MGVGAGAGAGAKERGLAHPVGPLGCFFVCTCTHACVGIGPTPPPPPQVDVTGCTMCPTPPNGATALITPALSVSAVFNNPSLAANAVATVMGATVGHIVAVRILPIVYQARSNNLRNLDGSPYVMLDSLATGFAISFTYSGSTVNGNMPQVRRVAQGCLCALVARSYWRDARLHCFMVTSVLPACMRTLRAKPGWVL
jgi:hypothetical protein